MEITVTKAAQSFLPKGFTKFLLAVNDGSNPYSSAQGCCLIGERFILVAVSEIPKEYSHFVESDGYTFYYSNYETYFLKGHLVLDVHESTHALILKNESGVLDDNVDVKVLLES